MNYTGQLANIELSNRIFACKSHKRALERELLELEFRYNGIPGKRKAATRSFRKTGIAGILLSLFLVCCLRILIPIFINIISSGQASKGDGILIILILPGTLLGCIACYKLWQHTLRLKAYLIGLKREEPFLQDKMNNMRKQMQELDDQINELSVRQKEKYVENIAGFDDVIE